MVFEEWMAFNSGLLLSLIFAVIIIIYFRLRFEVSKLKHMIYSRKDTTETKTETDNKDEPKEL